MSDQAMGFGINRGMGNFSSLSMLLMPHTATSAQGRTINGDGPSVRQPRLDQADQMTA
jgi:hypothetical protein